MSQVSSFNQLLEQLKNGHENAQHEILEFLSTIPIEERSTFEQLLLEAGFTKDDMHPLAAPPPEMPHGSLTDLRQHISSDHVLYTMIEEHEEILKLLDRLETLNTAIRNRTNYQEAKTDFQKIAEVIQTIIQAEPHHQREEQVLFPQLEAREILGPPHMMRMEHQELRRYKKAILEMTQTEHHSDFSACQKQLDSTAHLLINTLRQHIFKENNILYPMALQAIPDSDTWELLRDECDMIGYCPFTPGHQAEAASHLIVN